MIADVWRNRNKRKILRLSIFSVWAGVLPDSSSLPKRCKIIDEVLFMFSPF